MDRKGIYIIMPGINKVILVGRLGKDPELRHMINGDSVCNFSIATSETWNDKDTGEKKERTEWHRIEAWRRLAEICGDYLNKGKQVYIEGKLQTDAWEDRDGNKRYTTKIVAQNMQMLDSAGKGGSAESVDERHPVEEPLNIPEDDIPF